MAQSKYTLLLILVIPIGGCDGDSSVGLNRDQRISDTTVRMSHYFGVVAPSTNHSHGFCINNESNQKWTLADSKSSCGCALSAIKWKDIQPGKSATVEVRFQVGREPLRTTSALALRFNESRAPRIQLVVAADVREPITIIPDQLVLSNLSRKCEGEFTV